MPNAISYRSIKGTDSIVDIRLLCHRAYTIPIVGQTYDYRASPRAIGSQHAQLARLGKRTAGDTVTENSDQKKGAWKAWKGAEGAELGSHNRSILFVCSPSSIWNSGKQSFDRIFAFAHVHTP